MNRKIKKIGNETKLLKKLTEDSIKSSLIEPDLYTLYDVKKGLRDINGVGVLAGLTKIGDTVGHEYINGERVSIRGRLSYRGYEIEDIVEKFTAGDRFGVEETIYLLLFGERPDAKELMEFNELLSGYRMLPDTFVKENIMTAPSKDMINMLARSVLVLYSLDEKADDISIENVVRQSLQLIACFPMLTVYSYQSFMHYHCRKSLSIHKPLPELSTAENFLHMLRPDSKYTRLEAKLLDLALVLHAEFMLYKKVEEIGPRVIGETSKIYKGVSANVDFYSGIVYKMLDIPMELYTPIFAVSRIVGWSAHRIEELVNQGKIIRPAYKSVAPQRIKEKRLI